MDEETFDADAPAPAEPVGRWWERLGAPISTENLGRWLVTIAAVIALVNVGTFAMSPAPRTLTQPGPVVDIADHMTGTAAPDGTWYMTTVRTEQLSWWQVGWYRLFGDHTDKVTPSGEWTGDTSTADLQLLAYEQMNDAQRVAVGVALDQMRLRVGTPPGVDPTELGVEVDGIGGPSGGLMFTLAFIDSFTDGDLTGGIRIAGTGTISPDGTVGAVGGVDRKVYAAAENADLFFVPADGRIPAVPEGSDLTIIPVERVDDALRWLCAQPADDQICR